MVATSPILVTFEGADGSGKTTLLEAVDRRLFSEGIRTAVVGEFSESRYGTRLLDALAHDKFLRTRPGDEATVRTRALEVVADLYHLDERVIGPALAQGRVVLKDRHLDTVVYTLAVMSGAISGSPAEDDTIAWLKGLMAQIQHPPDLIIHVQAPPEVCLRRIAARRRDFAEERANVVSEEDLRVFLDRERVLRSLVAQGPHRFLVVNAGQADPRVAVDLITAAVRRRIAEHRECAGDRKERSA